jgi:hypothetical protein
VPDVGLYSVVKVLTRPSFAEGFDRLYYMTLRAEGTFTVEPWKEEAGDAGIVVAQPENG